MANTKVQYFGTGRRKSSVARVILSNGKGEFLINDRPFEEYIPSAATRLDVTQPLVLTETEEKIEQISKQLNKLIDVLKVTDISHNKNYIVREFIMVKISTAKNRSDLLQIIDLFRAKVLDLAPNYTVVSITGSPRKIKRFLESVHPFGIQELDRSGEFAVLDA